ncbi:MAG: glycosyltransferase family 4 protein [Nanoarchaeota archaeon]
MKNKNKKLKIGLIVRKFSINENDAYSAGPFLNSYNLSANLAKQGCEIHVFCSGKENLVKFKPLGKGKLYAHFLKIKDFNEKDTELKHKVDSYNFEARVTEYILEKNKKLCLDIIHTQGWPMTGFLLKEILKIRWIHTFRSLETLGLKTLPPEQKKYLELYEGIDNLSRYADKLIVVSKGFKKEILKEIKGIKDKTTFIHNGINLEIFNKSSSSPLGVLFVGRFSQHKGIDILPKIIEDVLEKDTSYKFYLVSQGNFEIKANKTIKSQIEKLQKRFPKRLKWYNEPISHNKLAEVHKKASISIQPSTYEAFGNTVIEALATGKATIVSNVGGMPEIVGNAGVVVKKYSAKSFSKQILKFLENPKLREEYSKKAFQRAKDFTWDKIAKRHLDVYNEAVKK